MTRGSSTRVRIAALLDGQRRQRTDIVATEEPMEVRVVAGGQAHPVSVTMRTPGHDFELAAGFLFTEGVIRERRAIERISYCTAHNQPQQYNVVSVRLHRDVAFDPARLSRHVYTTSSCGICGKASLDQVRAVCPRPLAGGLTVPDEILLGLPRALQGKQTIFARTGGLHAAALFDPAGKLLALFEDVGRHNALDKLVGSLLMQERLPASESVLLVSGRASFELVQKALMAGIPMLAAVGAPTSLAVELAREFGMTLIGFLRDARFNVYTEP